MWIGVLWAGLRAAMWITHVGGKFRHGLLELRSQGPPTEVKIGKSGKLLRGSLLTSLTQLGHASMFGSSLLASWEMEASACSKLSMVAELASQNGGWCI